MMNNPALRSLILKCTVSFILAASTPAFSQQGMATRAWTSSAGTAINGSLVGYRNGNATIAVTGKGNISVKKEQLSPIDQAYLASWEPPSSGNWTFENQIKEGFSGTVAGNNTKPGSTVLIAPMDDQKVFAVGSGELKMPLRIKALVPPGSLNEYQMIVYLVAKDSGAKVQNLQRFGLKDGYNEVNVKSATSNPANTRFDSGGNYIWLYLFAADKRDSCISNIIHIKVSVE